MADGVRFTWPRTVTQWDTALLAVRSGGAEQDPWVEVSVGEFRKLIVAETAKWAKVIDAANIKMN